MSLAIVLVWLGLLAYGAIAAAYPTYKIAQRLPSRYTQEEQATLAQWECLARVLGAIPRGSSVQLAASVIADGEWLQRIVEAGYPALDLSSEPGATFRVTLDEPGADSVAAERCGPKWVEVTRVAR